MRNLALSVVATLCLTACVEAPTDPIADQQVTIQESQDALFSRAPAAACWGQASKVFAQLGAMGEHSANQANPRLGLRNLARALYDAGVLAGDTMYDLGVFVAAELGLEIDACM
jgi:hypothetical protein